MEKIFNYSYSTFLNESKELCTQSNGLFTLCTNELLKISYIKSNIQIINDKYTLEVNIVFSETFKLPILYFIIYNNSTFTPISFEAFKNDNNIDTEMIKLCEISKENHPLTGNVYEYMHLCKLSQYINQVKDVTNILIFWMSIVFQLFNINLYKLLHK